MVTQAGKKRFLSCCCVTKRKNLWNALIRIKRLHTHCKLTHTQLHPLHADALRLTRTHTPTARGSTYLGAASGRTYFGRCFYICQQRAPPTNNGVHQLESTHADMAFVISRFIIRSQSFWLRSGAQEKNYTRSFRGCSASLPDSSIPRWFSAGSTSSGKLMKHSHFTMYCSYCG